MRGYVAILKIRAKVLLQYRAAAFAGIVTQVFWGMVQTMIVTAFYGGAGVEEPVTLAQAVTFIWLGQALLQLLPWSVDREIEAQVRSGQIAYELVRPLHVYSLWFARSLAMRLIPTMMRCVPVFVLGGLFFGLKAPVSMGAGVAFGGSVLGALFLSTAMTTFVITTLFWTVSGDGILRLLPAIVPFFSGMIIPLPLFPSWMQPFLDVQPFRGIMDIPCRLYTGVIPTGEAVYYLAFQVAWGLVFVGAGKRLLKRALKRFVIQGG